MWVTLLKLVIILLSLWINLWKTDTEKLFKNEIIYGNIVIFPFLAIKAPANQIAEFAAFSGQL